MPLLLASVAPARNDLAAWTDRLVPECRDRLSVLLPLRPEEIEFFDRLNDRVARRESRSLLPVNHATLPQHPHVLVEAYRSEAGCDCRRVLLNVLDAETGKHAATINYAFEPPGPPFEDEVQVFLDPLNPQSGGADAILALFQDMVSRDAAYHDRLVRHYEIWKAVINDPLHPAQAKIRRPRDAGGEIPAGVTYHRDEPKVGRNAPCPCGSGRKLKVCCGR